MVRYDQCWLILMLLAVASAASYAVAPAASLAFAALMAFTVYFFRDPDRDVPQGERTLVCPADGRVLELEDVDDPYVGKARRLSIFMSPLDVHVNRAPSAGRVASIRHTPGRKVAAYLRGELAGRERNRIEIDGATRLAVEQYAGVLARRTVCWVREGDGLQAGERFGMIRFGSRVDVIAPLSVDFKVHIGQRVVAGETVVGELHG